MKETFDTLAVLCLLALSAFTVWLMLQKKDGCGCGGKAEGMPAPTCPGASFSSAGMGGKRSMS